MNIPARQHTGRSKNTISEQPRRPPYPTQTGSDVCTCKNADKPGSVDITPIRPWMAV